MKVIVTGSRDWTDKAAVFRALDDVYGDECVWGTGHEFVVAHGACPTGADRFADEWCAARGDCASEENEMKVKELLELLRGIDPEREVILQKDAEGNGYSPLVGVDDNAAYIPDTTWSGDVRRQTLSEADIARGFGEDDLTADPSAVPALVLYPVN